MIHQLHLVNNFLYIFICILLLTVFNNSHIKAQDVDEVSDINLRLEKIMDTDQNTRKELDYAFEHFGHNSPEFILATKNLNTSDSINQIQIDSIFHQYGWLTPPSVSEEASKTYFYVIQHAQYEFQKKYKSHVILAFEKGVIDMQEYMFFIDRLAIREQKYQKYGTQILHDNLGNEYFAPIDTTNNSTSHLLEEMKREMQNKDFILFSNHHLITLFVHSFNPITNSPVSSIDIYLDDVKIGETNLGGFFQTLLPRRKGESILTIMNTNTGKKQSKKLDISEHIDFFDTYFGFK